MDDIYDLLLYQGKLKIVENPINLLLLGDGGTGKTAYIDKLLSNKFSSRYIATANITTYIIPIYTMTDKYSFTVYDMPSQIIHSAIREKYYKEATHAIIMITEFTKNNIDKWINDLRKINSKLYIILVKNKYDINPSPIKDKYIKSINVEYTEISVKTGYNIYSPFKAIIDAKNNENCEIIEDNNVSEEEVKKLHTISTAIRSGNENINHKFADNETLLTISINLEYYHIVKFLLNFKDLDVNTVVATTGDTPLIISVSVSNIRIFKLLAEHPNINVNAINNEGYTALSYAISENKTDIAKILLNIKGIDTTINIGPINPLVLAVSKNNTDIVYELLKRNDINPNIKDANNRSALLHSIKNNNINIFSALLKIQNINVNEQISNTYPIIIICMDKNIDMLKELLLRQDVNVNARNEYGNTPLIICSYYNNIEMVKLLLNSQHQNINVYIKNNNNMTAYNMISNNINGNTEILALIRAHISKSLNVVKLDQRYNVLATQMSENTECIICFEKFGDDNSNFVKCPACKNAIMHIKCITRLRDVILNDNLSSINGNLKELSCPNCRNTEVWKNLLLE